MTRPMAPLVWREWAAPNRWTFRIPRVARLLRELARTGRGWADPFAGRSTWAEYRNDLDPLMPQRAHREAADWLTEFEDGELLGVVLDPPYTREQIARHYRGIGKNASALDTSNRFYARVQDQAARVISPRGYAVSFGYTSLGLGVVRGFVEVEAGVLVHGAGHYATSIVVEVKTE